MTTWTRALPCSLTLCLCLGLTACESGGDGGGGSSWVTINLGMLRGGAVVVDLTFEELQDTPATVDAWIGCGDRPTDIDQAIAAGEQVLDDLSVEFDSKGQATGLEVGAPETYACESSDFWVVYCTTSMGAGGRPVKVCTWGQGDPETKTEQTVELATL